MNDLLTLENTAIVLDSTCDPPAGFFDRPGLSMVPLKVHFGDETFRDAVDMTYQEFFAKLEASEVLPTTSQPTAGEFLAVYEEAQRGRDGARVVDLDPVDLRGGLLGGTHGAAHLAGDVQREDAVVAPPGLLVHGEELPGGGLRRGGQHLGRLEPGEELLVGCLLYTSDAADE